MIDQAEVPFLSLTAHRCWLSRDGHLEKQLRNVHFPGHKGIASVVVARRIVPQLELAKAVALASSSRKLEGRMHYIRLQLLLLVQARDEESVARSEYGNGQNANDKGAIGTPEKTLFGEWVILWRKVPASPHQSARAESLSSVLLGLSREFCRTLRNKANKGNQNDGSLQHVPAVKYIALIAAGTAAESTQV